MATKISNLEELREEKMRLQLQLSHQEETLLRHYAGFKRQLTPIASLLNQLGWLGNKTVLPISFCLPAPFLICRSCVIKLITTPMKGFHLALLQTVWTK